MNLHRIGTLHTPFRSRDECPRNGRQPNPPPLCHAALLPEFHEALLGLDGFSHLIVLYWLDQASFRGELVFTPPFHDTPRGLFATRAPARPNPIGLSVVAFHGFEVDRRLRLQNLDCIDGTPLLDIKPYLPTTDAEPLATMGWLAGHAARPAG